MKVTNERIERSRVVLNIQVDSDEMEEAVRKAYRRVGAKASIPGFRKGKVPPAILEQYIGREAVVEDAAEHLLPEVYERALDEQQVDAIARPEVEVLQVEPLSFKATVPVRPTVELGDYHEIKFSPEPVEVTEEEVSESLEQLRVMQAPWAPVDGPAELEDLLSVSVEGVVDGEVVIDEKDGVYQMSESIPGALPGFAEQLVGAKKEEERSFTLTIPEGRGDLGGKECAFTVQVKEIKRKTLPELDDEFAKGLGEAFDSLDALKNRVIETLKGKKEQEARSNLEEKAIKALVDMATVEYPDVMVDSELDHLVEENRRQHGNKEALDTYLDSIGKTEDEFRAELRPMAERIVIRSIVIQKFAELEGIQVGLDEINAEVEQMVQHVSDDSVRQVFDTPQARVSLGRNLFVKKAIERLYEVVTGESSLAVKADSMDDAVQDETSPAKEEEGEDAQGSE
jgi:trigger factor